MEVVIDLTLEKVQHNGKIMEQSTKQCKRLKNHHMQQMQVQMK